LELLVVVELNDLLLESARLALVDIFSREKRNAT
jgi:hypothetical protein